MFSVPFESSSLIPDKDEQAVTTFEGPPASSEGDPGPYTLGLFLRDAAARNAQREALVFHEEGNRISWSWESRCRTSTAEASRSAT